MNEPRKPLDYAGLCQRIADSHKVAPPGFSVIVRLDETEWRDIMCDKVVGDAIRRLVIISPDDIGAFVMMGATVRRGDG